jgi:acetyl esterase/lipase
MTSRIFTRRALLRASCAGAAALLAGCSPFGIVNGLVPSQGYRTRKDVAYGAHPRQRLDVYQPDTAHAPAPVIVFFYGGNWNAGERRNYLFVGEALASKGFVAVIPDYRLYPDVRFPDFLHDCAAATRWTLEHIAELGGDPKRLFLMGHSAGAYNAAMLAFDSQYLRGANVDPRQVRGFIGLAGPYDFLPLTGPISKAVFGFPDTSPTTQPIHFASAEDPPALLVAGDADRTVDPGNSARLAAALRKRGVAVREIVYPGVSHMKIVGALAAPFRGIAPVLDDVAAFITDPSR